MHRRAATLKTYRPSTADESSTLRESPDDSMSDDSLRRQLIEKDRENDRLRAQVKALEMQLSQRPSKETVNELEKEYNHLELLLQGTQKENERCMRELDTARSREKQLEKEIEKLAGSNWRDNLEVAPNAFAARTAAITRGQNASASNTSLTATPMPPSGNSAETVAQMEQIRLLIMGMEKRLESHEEKFGRSVERAEHEGRKFQELRKELHLMGTS